MNKLILLSAHYFSRISKNKQLCTLRSLRDRCRSLSNSQATFLNVIHNLRYNYSVTLSSWCSESRRILDVINKSTHSLSRCIRFNITFHSKSSLTLSTCIFLSGTIHAPHHLHMPISIQLPLNSKIQIFNGVSCRYWFHGEAHGYHSKTKQTWIDKDDL